MSYFLIEFDRGTKALLKSPPTAFADDRLQDALQARQRAQAEVERNGLDRDIVLLQAESLDDLKRTHGSFFANSAGMQERLEDAS